MAATDSDDTDTDATLEQDMDEFFGLIRRLAGQQEKPDALHTESKPKPKSEKAPVEVLVLDEKLIAGMLTSADRSERVKGRLLATGIVDTISTFATHERDRGTHVSLVMLALTTLSAMVTASVIVQFANDQEASERLTDALSKEYERLLRTLVAGWDETRA
jgi:hypothetical protein